MNVNDRVKRIKELEFEEGSWEEQTKAIQEIRKLKFHVEQKNISKELETWWREYEQRLLKEINK